MRNPKESSASQVQVPAWSCLRWHAAGPYLSFFQLSFLHPAGFDKILRFEAQAPLRAFGPRACAAAAAGAAVQVRSGSESHMRSNNTRQLSKDDRLFHGPSKLCKPHRRWEATQEQGLTSNRARTRGSNHEAMRVESTNKHRFLACRDFRGPLEW